MRNGCITLAGVKHVTIELDRDGGRYLMLSTDPTIGVHLIAQDDAVCLIVGLGQWSRTQKKINGMCRRDAYYNLRVLWLCEAGR